MQETLTLEEPLVFLDEPGPSRFRFWRFIGKIFRGIFSGFDWLIGALSLLLGLSILAALPLAQFLSLGYLLEASARVARSGRIRDGIIGVRRASRVGTIVACCWLWLLPARFVSSLATSAELIDPDGPIARGWRVGLLVVVVMTLIHIVSSCARGGRLRHFLWLPGNLLWLIKRLGRGGLYAESRDATCSFVEALRLPYYFRLGSLGFVATLVWLIVPITLLALGRRMPPVGLLGAFCLGFVVLSLPFLQIKFAIEGRFRAMFEVKVVRERFRRAPWAFSLAFLLTVVAAIPLYLLKIELIPREVAWLPGLLFVAFLFPARIACGWAYGRGGLRENRRFWLWRGVGRLAMLPIAAAYVLIVFLAQYTSWGGAWSLYEQHAFLLPVPFLGY
jgi:hypothetical protein